MQNACPLCKCRDVPVCVQALEGPNATLWLSPPHSRGSGRGLCNTGQLALRSHSPSDPAIHLTLESLLRVRVQEFSRVRLCDPMDCSPPGCFVHEISQARILEWVAISFSRDLPDPGITPASLVAPALAGRFFTTEPLGNLTTLKTLFLFATVSSRLSVSSYSPST